jgi:type II secretion system protein G
MSKVGKAYSRGFTIVELLIVIVIIGVLASLVVVAYNGIQTRANVSKMQSDLRYMVKLLELYKADNGSYPPTPNGSGGYNHRYGRIQGDNFIPGLVPAYANSLPQITGPWSGGTNNNTYIYYSSGASYSLERLYQPTLPAGEAAAVQPPAVVNTTYNDRWGYQGP